MVKAKEKNSFDTRSRQKQTRLRSETQYESAFIFFFFRPYFEFNGPNRFHFLVKILFPWKFIAKSISRSSKRHEKQPSKFVVVVFCRVIVKQLRTPIRFVEI